MKRKFYVLALGLATVALATFLWHKWNQDEPRRDSFQAVQTFATALNSGDADALLQTVVLPAALSGRTPAEQTEFLTKALRDEISPEGLAVLRRQGQFGSLTNLFPAEAKVWAEQAGVKPENCVAFKLERNGIRAEVVLAHESTPGVPNSAQKIVRCNNVRQLAPTP